MKRNGKDSYWYLLMMLSPFLMLVIGYIFYEMGFDGSDGGIDAMKVLGILLGIMIIVGGIFRAFHTIGNVQGGTTWYKIAVVVMALLILLMRFNRVFEWF